MRTRGIRLALALALVLALGAASTADASTRLTRKEAKRMAVKLGRKQVRKFDLRFYELGRPRRLGPRGIAFRYAARTRANTYCRATLRVRKRARGRRVVLIARIGRQRCRRMPADAVAIETATRKAQRAVRPFASLLSLIDTFDLLGPCLDMRVPRSRRVAVDDVVFAVAAKGLYRPNRRALRKFADRLDLVDTTHVVLADAVAGWIDYVEVVEALPSFERPCATLRRWKRHRWRVREAPFDVRALRGLVRRAEADDAAVVRGRHFLRRVGAYPRVAAGFDLLGLVLGFDEFETEVDEIGGARAMKHALRAG